MESPRSGQKNPFDLWELWILTSERSFQESGWNIREVGLISILGLSVAHLPTNFQLPLWRHEGPAYFTGVSHILGKWLPLNVPYLPKHRQSQACYKALWTQMISKHTAPSWPETWLRSSVYPAHPIAFLIFSGMHILSCAKDWAPITALTYWCYLPYPITFGCFILKGKSLGANEKAFWNYRKKLRNLGQPLSQNNPFWD